MNIHTRVLSKDDLYPTRDELTAPLAEHPGFKLVVEEGDDEEWESLLLVSDDGVEVALLQRHEVSPASIGEDEIADLLEDLRGCQPESSVEWLDEYLAEVKTVYDFEHLQGAYTVDGGNALHALRSCLWERGEAIQQADGDGFTNEDGYHIVWQFADTVSGLWNMGVLQDDVWRHFRMDLGDPDHRAAFLAGEVPEDVSEIRS